MRTFGPPLRILFLGSGDFGVPILNSLVDSAHRVVGVVTTKERPKGRGLQPRPTPLKVAAEKRGLAVMQVESLEGEKPLADIAALSPSIGVIAAFGIIIPAPLLGIPALGYVNVHPSLLPQYRGASPIQWTIMNGERETGVTLILADERVDHGPILVQRKIQISKADDAPALHDRLSRVAAESIVDALEGWSIGKIVPIPQDERMATQAPKLSKEQGRVDWKEPSIVIERKLRAFRPWPGLFSRLNSKTIKVLSAAARSDHTERTPGSITTFGPNGIEVACGKGTLLISELQPENKRGMTAAEFLNGHPLKRKDRFS